MLSSFFDYVPKNKTLPKIREYIEGSPEGAVLLDELLQALKDKNPEAAIFSHEYALMLTQILFERNRISENERMTILVYLTALRVHTHKQALREEDQDTKVICNVDMISPGDPRYQDFLRRYVEEIYQDIITSGKRKTRIGLTLSFNISPIRQSFVDALIQKIEKASRFESALLCISPPLDEKDNSHPSYQSLFSIFPEGLFFFCGHFEKEKLLIIPSATIFKYLMEELNSELSIGFSPILGQLKPEKLFRDFHQNQKHCVSIYSQHILSNPKTVHGLRGGALFAILHDYFHTMLTTLLFNKTMHQFYTQELIPFMLRFKDIMTEKKELLSDFDNMNKNIQEVIEKLNDYLVPDRNGYVSVLSLILFLCGNYTTRDECFIKGMLILIYSTLSPDYFSKHELNPFVKPVILEADLLMTVQKLSSEDLPKRLSEWHEEDLRKLFDVFNANYHPINSERAPITLAYNAVLEDETLKRKHEESPVEEGSSKRKKIEAAGMS